MTGKKKYLSWLILFVAVLAVLANHAFGYIGHYGYDDLHYGKLANDLSSGVFDFNDNYSFRFSLILFTSIAYKIFGISDFSSSLSTIIFTIPILVLVFFVVRKHGYVTLTIALSLTVFSQWLLFYSDKLMPDVFVAFAFMLAIFILDNYKFRSTRNNTFLHALLFSFSLFFGLLSKETILLILPLLVYLFIADLVLKRDLRFWVYSIIFGVIFLVLYFGYIGIVTGEITTRFKAIAAGSYLNQCSYDKESVIIILRRISYQFFALLCNTGMLTSFVFLIAFLTGKEKTSFFRFSDSFSFYLLASFILLLTSNFMSISFKAYIPLCLDPRHYLFLVPVSAIPASIIIKDILKKNLYRTPVLVSLLVLLLISLFSSSEISFIIYLLLFLLFTPIYFFPTKQIFQKLFPVLFFLILSIPLFQNIKYATKVNYGMQKEIVFKYLLNQRENCYVLTNDVQKRLGIYYSGFDKTCKTEFLKYGSFNLDTLDGRKKYLLRNWYTEYLSKLEVEDLPYYAKNFDKHDSLVMRDEKLNISIYLLNNEAIQVKKETVIFQSINGFENDYPFWNQNNNQITSQVKYAGSKSSLINEYSSAFRYPMDSLHLKTKNNLILRSSLYCNFKDKTKAQIVISLQDEKGVYLWKSLEINKYLRAYSNWCLVKFEISIAADEIKPNSILSTYLWNIDKGKGYIDNFEMTISKVGR
jgi:hypothetical protein